MAGQAQGGGEVVAWRCRVVAPNGNKGMWVLTDEPSVSGGCIEVEPLYSRPPTPSAPVGVGELHSLIYLWRQPEPDNGEDETEFDLGCAQTYRECADALEAVIAQQPAAVDGAK